MMNLKRILFCCAVLLMSLSGSILLAQEHGNDVIVNVTLPLPYPQDINYPVHGHDGANGGNGGDAGLRLNATGNIDGSILSNIIGGDGAEGGDASATLNVNNDIVNGNIDVSTVGGYGTDQAGDARMIANINTDDVNDIQLSAIGGCGDNEAGNVTAFDVTIDTQSGGDITLLAQGGCGATGGDVSDMNIAINGDVGDISVEAIGGCANQNGTGGNTGDINMMMNGDLNAEDIHIRNTGCNNTDSNVGDVNVDITGTIQADTMTVDLSPGCGNNPTTSGETNLSVSGTGTFDAVQINNGPCGNSGDLNMDVSGALNADVTYTDNQTDCTTTSNANIDISGTLNNTNNNHAFLGVSICKDFHANISGSVSGDVALGTQTGDISLEITGTIDGDVLTGGGNASGVIQVVLSGNASVSGIIDGGNAINGMTNLTNAYSSLTFNFVTENRAEYETFITQLATANPAGGSIVFRGRTYTWINFDGLINQLRLIEEEAQGLGIDPSAFCLQSRAAISVTGGTITIYNSTSTLLTHNPENDVAGPEHILLAQSADAYASLYLLNTGEYQVNIGPDFEGKTHSCVWETPDAPVNLRQTAF